MDITSRQYRVVERTRHRNRREQRLFEHSLNSKHGLLASHKHEMQTMKRETAKVQKELHKINRGYPYFKRPGGDYGRPNRPVPVSENDSTVPATNEAARETQWGLTKETNVTTTPRRGRTYRGKEGVTSYQEDSSTRPNKSTKQQNPSKTKETVRANSTRSNNSHTKSNLISIDNGSLVNNKENKRLYNNMINKDKSTATDEPVIKDNKSNGFQSNEIAMEEQQKSPRRSDKASVRPIGSISVSDAKENVAKRLLSSKGKEDEERVPTIFSPRYSAVFEGPGPIDALPQFAAEDVVDADPNAAAMTNKAPILNLKNKSQKKAYEDMLEKLTFDAETYGPDGHLRTVHVMPSFEHRIEQAKKARYVRHRDRPDFERELSVSKIFEGMKSSDSNTPT